MGSVGIICWWIGRSSAELQVRITFMDQPRRNSVTTIEAVIGRTLDIGLRAARVQASAAGFLGPVQHNLDLTVVAVRGAVT